MRMHRIQKGVTVRCLQGVTGNRFQVYKVLDRLRVVEGGIDSDLSAIAPSIRFRIQIGELPARRAEKIRHLRGKRRGSRVANDEVSGFSPHPRVCRAGNNGHGSDRRAEHCHD
jgi:hypothetical protein